MNVQLALYKHGNMWYTIFIRIDSANKNKQVIGEKMDVKREYVYALGFCILNKNTSVAMLQRMTNWGYARASTAIEWMEENRYITPFTSITPRKILMSLRQYKLSFADYLNEDRLFRKKYEKDLLALLESQQ